MTDYIKYCALILLRFILCVFNIFPIRNNRIVLYSFNGKQYSCNPRRITEYLLLHCPDKYEIIWAFKDPHKQIDILPHGVKSIKYRSIEYYYYAKTAKVIIQNVQGFGELSRRRGQYVIQTWHASNGYKKQGEYLGIRRKLELLYHKDYSYVLSGADSMTERRVRGSMGFCGEVTKGTPRMDVIINNDDSGIDRKVRDWLKVANSTQIVLYAPTWRKDRKQNDYGLDYLETLNYFENKFGGDWVLAVRFHPNVYCTLDKTNPRIIDATNYPDMQELLCVVDALISDYSSCIWDYSFRKKPCFLFCTDIEKYGNDRDFDIPIYKWGFPIATNMMELKKKIDEYDEQQFIEAINKHHVEMGSYEDGHSTERICNLINSLCGEY